MTGTNCDLFTHNQSQSYLNHLVSSLVFVGFPSGVDEVSAFVGYVAGWLTFDFSRPGSGLEFEGQNAATNISSPAATLCRKSPLAEYSVDQYRIAQERMHHVKI
jgi:hypothetical protein